MDEDDDDEADDHYDWSGARSGFTAASGAPSMVGSTINFSDIGVRRQYMYAHNGGDGEKDTRDDNSDSDDEANWAHVDGARNDGQTGDVFSSSAGIDAFDFGESSSAGADFFGQSPIVSPEKFDTGAGSGFFATFDQAAPAQADVPAVGADPTGFFSFASFPSAVSAGPASPEKEEDGFVGGVT